MVSPKQLRSTIESALLGPGPPSPGLRLELMHAIRASLPSLRSILSYPGPTASDRAQVKSKEIRLPDSSLVSLDDLDVQIAIKLSDDLSLNEVECVRLLCAANQEWVLFGREPLEIYRLAAGLWYTERRDVLTSFYTLFRAVVLDQGIEANLVAEIQSILEDLLTSGLRQHLISLIKDLSREEPSGIGGPTAERHVLDSRGALVERQAVVSRERLMLGHCLVLSVLVVRISSKDAKDIFSSLKDFASVQNQFDPIIQLQITFSLLFSLVIAFISDALSVTSNQAAVLSDDDVFKSEFHELVMKNVDTNITGFCDVVRLAWTVHLMLSQDENSSADVFSRSSSQNLSKVFQCLEIICTNNVFQFLLVHVLQSVAYQTSDEDMVYMYNAYLHKLMMCFLSHPLTRDKVKEIKENTMISLSKYPVDGEGDQRDNTGAELRGAHYNHQQFISLMELISEIYKKEPELACGNDDLWTFVIFSGEDHTNIKSLVAFLNMLGVLAISEEGASKVYGLLGGKTFRSVGWKTLFDCLSIYEDKFRQSIQSNVAVLPELLEGDAKALVAYLEVLRKVVEHGNEIERKNWFPDIEPLFKLLGFESVPPYLKGALRNAIGSFINVSAMMKDTIWAYLEQYDLPVAVSPLTRNSAQVYDIRFELNEVEARLERYPSTISFLKLLNSLIEKEKVVGDHGERFLWIFRFISDNVFSLFPQRAYSDPHEKWELVVACLQHFKMILSMYELSDDIIDMESSRQVVSMQTAATEKQIPSLELLKDFMSGRTIFRNIMSILLLGANSIIHDRSTKTYGQLLEKAVHISLEILILVFEKDLLVAGSWRPLYQSLDIILSQDHTQVVTLLEYVRYDFLPEIQQCSIKIMNIFSSRIEGLVPLLLKSNAAKCLIEDYAACLESRFEEFQIIENHKDDSGVLILQLLLDNIASPAPNITHLLLKFDVDAPVDHTVLDPKYHYSCLKVILKNLDQMSNPHANGLLYEFSYQLLYELCTEPLTSWPTLDLLSSKKYHFFSKHVETMGLSPLPRRTTSHDLRVSSFHQRAWSLKLLALELHVADMAIPTHRDACVSILSHIFGQISDEIDRGQDSSRALFVDSHLSGGSTVSRSKILRLLDTALVRCPEAASSYSQILANMKCDFRVDDILKNPSTSEKGGVYYYSERGDRLIDLEAFHDRIWQRLNLLHPHLGSPGMEAELDNIKESIQQLLRWGWKYNTSLEEQAAQLHYVTAWTHIVEVSVSRRMMFLEDRTELLFELLDASLGASVSPDCSLKMAVMLSQVALTCMAKLRDETFVCPISVDTDNVTCLDVVYVRHLPSGACQSLLHKLLLAILRSESSEILRRRQYALVLSYFQYCRSILHPDFSRSVLGFLLREENEGADSDLHKADREQAELSRANFGILKREAQGVLDLLTKDAIQGSEAGKAISLYVLDAFISIDQDRFFLGQLQSRGFLRSCLVDIGNFPWQDGCRSLDSLQRLCTLEAKLAFLLRISHSYEKYGGQILMSMGALEYLRSCRVLDSQMKGIVRSAHKSSVRDFNGIDEGQRLVLSPALRLVSSLTSLAASSEQLEVKNKIVREVLDFVRVRQSTFDEILRKDFSSADEFSLEQLNLVVYILSKVWPYEEDDEYGFIQELFRLMSLTFALDGSTFIESRKEPNLFIFRVCYGLISHLYSLIGKRDLRIQISSKNVEGRDESQQPTLLLIASFLGSITSAFENSLEEMSVLLNKIENINELSRQDVDEIIISCRRESSIIPSDTIRKRRYIAMVEMCHVAGERDRLISLLLQIAEHAVNILLIHFRQGENVLKGSFSALCEKLFPILERLEQLREDNVGQSLKMFQRSVRTLKELAVARLAI